MRLSKKFTTVTPFSKMLALSLFIICPIIGFYLGVYYQQQTRSGLPKFVCKLSQTVCTAPIIKPIRDNEPTKFCGGIAGRQCDSGYTCRLKGNYPDAGGTCIKKEETANSNGGIINPSPTCRPRPACLDATPHCMIAETADMCPKAI